MIFLDNLVLNGAPAWYECEPAWHWAPPALIDFDLWFVGAGRGELRLGERVWELQPHTAFVLRPGSRPLGFHDKGHPLRVFYCHFSFSTEAEGEDFWPDAMRVRDAGFFVASAHRAERLWRRGDQSGREGARDCLRNLLWQLADEARQAPPSPVDAALDELVGQIRRAPGQKWELDAMARAVHLSRAQFVRRFRAAFGQSPAQFVIEVRLERARQLLLETNLSLEQIAGALGYANSPFFARQFCQATSQTPGQFRRGSR